MASQIGTAHPPQKTTRKTAHGKSTRHVARGWPHEQLALTARQEAAYPDAHARCDTPQRGYFSKISDRSHTWHFNLPKCRGFILRRLVREFSRRHWICFRTNRPSAHPHARTPLLRTRGRFVARVEGRSETRNVSRGRTNCVVNEGATTIGET